MATQLFRTRDGDVLARIRSDGAAIPEVFDPRDHSWHQYAELDTWHDARPIDTAEALTMGANPDDLAA